MKAYHACSLRVTKWCSEECLRRCRIGRSVGGLDFLYPGLPRADSCIQQLADVAGKILGDRWNKEKGL
jgi:hypothetical protein